MPTFSPPRRRALPSVPCDRIRDLTLSVDLPYLPSDRSKMLGTPKGPPLPIRHRRPSSSQAQLPSRNPGHIQKTSASQGKPLHLPTHRLRYRCAPNHGEDHEREEGSLGIARTISHFLSFVSFSCRFAPFHINVHTGRMCNRVHPKLKGVLPRSGGLRTHPLVHLNSLSHPRQTEKVTSPKVFITNTACIVS